MKLHGFSPWLSAAAVCLPALLAAGCSEPSPESRPASTTEGTAPTGQRSIVADFYRLPLPPDTLPLTLPADAFPAGKTFTMKPAQGCPWTFETYTDLARSEEVKFAVTAPETLRLAGGDFVPPMDIDVTLEEEGRPDEQYTLRLLPQEELADQVAAEPPVVAVPRAAEPITIDGVLAEWQAVPLLHLPFHGQASRNTRLAWRDDGLYGAVDVADSNIEVNVEDTWTADALELWIETDHRRALDVARNPNAQKFVFLTDPADNGPGKAQVLVVTGLHKGQETGTTAAWQKTDRGYTLEFRIPAAVLAPASMQPGTRMGLHFILFDDGGHVEEFVASVLGFYRKPYVWGAIELKK